jgi:hypothetical protein
MKRKQKSGQNEPSPGRFDGLPTCFGHDSREMNGKPADKTKMAPASLAMTGEITELLVLLSVSFS